MRYHRNPAANKDEIVQLLKQLLANTYLLYIQTQGAHWNVIGNDFPQLHTLFQTQYTELTLATDLLAEHIRTYGAVAPASAGEFLELATFEENLFTKQAYGGQADSKFLLQMLIDQHRATIEVATQLGAITGNALHTQNLAADRIEAHEKAVWMLESTLNRGSSHRRNPYWY
jgi:starvation-inducible DNA-binding protein